MTAETAGEDAAPAEGSAAGVADEAESAEAESAEAGSAEAGSAEAGSAAESEGKATSWSRTTACRLRDRKNFQKTVEGGMDPYAF